MRHDALSTSHRKLHYHHQQQPHHHHHHWCTWLHCQHTNTKEIMKYCSGLGLWFGSSQISFQHALPSCCGSEPFLCELHCCWGISHGGIVPETWSDVKQNCCACSSTSLILHNIFLWNLVYTERCWENFLFGSYQGNPCFTWMSLYKIFIHHMKYRQHVSMQWVCNKYRRQYWLCVVWTVDLYLQSYGMDSWKVISVGKYTWIFKYCIFCIAIGCSNQKVKKEYYWSTGVQLHLDRCPLQCMIQHDCPCARCLSSKWTSELMTYENHKERIGK